MKTCSFPLDDLSDGVGAVNELQVPILSFLCEINGIVVIPGLPLWH